MKKVKLYLLYFIKFLWGILCIPFIPMIIISCAGYALYELSITDSPKNLKRYICIIKNDILSVLKIFYIPLSLLAIIGRESYNVSNSFVGFVKKIMEELIKFLKTKFHELFPSYNRRKFERLKRHLFINKNETFLNSNLHRIVLIATLLLQCISFFTTFRGALSFFEEIHWIAPIFFTLVLQGMLLLLANVAFSKKRRFSTRKVLLFFLCAISIFLSYVGIANSVLPPTEDYKQEYEKFSHAYSKIYEEIDQKNTGNDVKHKLEMLRINIDNITNYTKNQIDSLVLSKYDLTTIDKYETINSYQPDGTYSTQRVLSKEYTSAISENNKTEKLISDLETKLNSIQFDDFKNNIENSDIESITNHESLKRYIANNNDIVLKYHDLITKYNILVVYLNTKYNFGDSFETYPDSFSEFLSTNMIDNFDDLKIMNFVDIENKAATSIQNFEITQNKNYKTIYNTLLGESKQATYNEKVLQYVKNEIESKTAILAQTLDMLKNDSLDKMFRGEGNSLMNIKNDLVFYDSYLIAILRFKTNLAYALLMLFFAVLVDGLTVAIPLFTEKRRESILYAKSNLDILDDHEDILEDCLLSCAFNMNIEDLEVNEHGYYDESVYAKMLNVFVEYLKAFEPSPYTTDLGYSKKMPVVSTIYNGRIEFGFPTANNEFSAKYHELNSLLLDLKYIKYVSKQEYYLLKCDYLNIEPHDQSLISGNTKYEKGYFLLKGQFVMWLNEGKVGIFNMKKTSKNKEV